MKCRICWKQLKILSRYKKYCSKECGIEWKKKYNILYQRRKHLELINRNEKNFYLQTNHN